MKIKNTKMVVVILLGMFVMLVSCEKTEVEWGCMDPNASNYYPEAVKDNGNCRYDDDTSTPTQNTYTITFKNNTDYDVDIEVLVYKDDLATSEYFKLLGNRPTLQPLTINYDSTLTYGRIEVTMPNGPTTGFTIYTDEDLLITNVYGELEFNGDKYRLVKHATQDNFLTFLKV